MKKVALLFVLLIVSGVYSQKLTHPINPSPEKFKVSVQSTEDTIFILAAMVQFAEDKDAATYGNGKFGSHYSKNYGNEIIDPLPHNKSYFEDQLTSLKNYYKNCSGDKVKISFQILDSVITLPEVMSKYSPPAGSSDFTNLGKLFQTTWQAADSLNPNFDFSKFQLFVIFHAGVGRDINISQNFNSDKDIPSVYLNLNSLKKYLGNNFSGLLVNKGKKLITNSMIIPETESREVSSFTGAVLLEVGIQGLIISSFASYLGLPDLYDTKTGLSAIGRFGLMDGQAIFSYGGVLPPEPSAWEKVYLGWVTPEVINPEKNSIQVQTRLASVDRTGKVFKIPINSTEYYLIENRQRDALKTGLNIKFSSNGQILEKRFEKDTTGFRYYDIDSLKGVVLSADQYDWALPGSGLAIWHIDEKIIAENFQSNTINADWSHRGVRLVEAKGIQEIGVKFTDIFGEQVVGDGDPTDLWFRDNKAKLYTNEFSEDTKPNTISNSGAPSFLKLNNFSGNSNMMSFDLSYTTTSVKPVIRNRVNSSANKQLPIPVSTSSTYQYFYSANTLFRNELSGNKTESIRSDIKFTPSFFKYQNDEYIAFISGDSLYTLKLSNSSIEKKSYVTNAAGVSTSPVFIIDSYDFAVNEYLLFGDSSGNIYKFSLASKNITKTKPANSAILNISFVPPGLYIYTTATDLYYRDKKFSLGYPEPVKTAVAIDSNWMNSTVFVLYKNNKVESFNSVGKISSFSLISNTSITNFLLGDIKNDGNIYLIYSAQNEIYAMNKYGFIAPAFPVKNSNTLFSSNINLADINSDKIPEIFIETNDGQVQTYNTISGKLLKDLRLSTGIVNSGSSSFRTENGKTYYYTLSDSGSFQIFQIGNYEFSVHWNGKNGNMAMTNAALINQSKGIYNSFMPKSNVYNWPNPVYSNSTNIRYYVSKNSKINIKIFDLSGALVDELNNTAPGGVESETKWNVSEIQSGVYFARVEATSESESDYVIIKIAVVK